MAYSTNLLSWGDAGVAYPEGYSHIEGEQPVDAWENYFKHNVIADIKWLIDEVNGISNISVSENDSPVLGDVADLNFIGPVNVSDDDDGTVTVNLSHNHDTRYLRVTGNVAQQPLAFDNGHDLTLNTGTSVIFKGDESGGTDRATFEKNSGVVSLEMDSPSLAGRFSVSGFDAVDLSGADSMLLPKSPTGGMIAPQTNTPSLYWDTDAGELRMYDATRNPYRVEVTPVGQSRPELTIHTQSLNVPANGGATIEIDIQENAVWSVRPIEADVNLSFDAADPTAELILLSVESTTSLGTSFEFSNTTGQNYNVVISWIETL
jgi:hypothetical protein